jgi:hypothetical protein
MLEINMGLSPPLIKWDIHKGIFCFRVIVFSCQVIVKVSVSYVDIANYKAPLSAVYRSESFLWDRVLCYIGEVLGDMGKDFIPFISWREVLGMDDKLLVVGVCAYSSFSEFSCRVDIPWYDEGEWFSCGGGI